MVGELVSFLSRFGSVRSLISVMENIMSLLDKITSRATVAPKSPSLGGDPIDKFKDKIKEQIAYVEASMAGQTVPSKSSWFKTFGGGFKTKVGYSALVIGGKDWFKADNYADLVVFYNDILALVDEDDAFRKQIVAKSEAVSTRLSGSRGPKKKK